MPGQPTTIDPNRYEILAELGRGGMGVVFKARDRETGDIVALKVLKPEIADDPAAIERFKNELRLARKITHKNVCRIYEFNRSDASAYISMEFVDGENLQAILSRTKRLEIGEGVRIARQICAGLREAHLQGIIHRDLKPANIMIASDGSPKVMDFGIARSVDTSATATGMVVGTPSYVAPEQAEGKAVDPRTDIYTLGLILYEIFTGKVAFTGDSALSVALKQIHETPPSPREIQPSLPPYIEIVILRCLQKDPALRFQSVDELDAALAGESPTGPIPTEPAASPIRTLGRTLRKPVWISLAVALVLLSLWFLVFRSEAKFELSFKELTLKNGMRVILSEDHSAPTFTICVTYNVGSRNERPGQTGFAHLFEHLMFQGSANVGKGEHLILIQNHGGSPNGITRSDFTLYWETLPANQLDLALFLEADRMRSLDINQAKLSNERNVVLQERRQHHENKPYGPTELVIPETAYDSFAYKHPAIGTPEDLNAARLEDVAEFFKAYYAPNNAVVTLVGDFNAGEAEGKLRKYFEEVPSRPLPVQPELGEAKQDAERRKTIDDPFAQAPRIDIVYKVPPENTDDGFGISMVVSLLSSGSSSRLYQKLVKEKEVAATIYRRFDSRRGPSLAGFSIMARPGKEFAEIEKLVYEEIDRLRTEPVAEWESEKARLQMRHEHWAQFQSTLARGSLLGKHSVLYNDPGALNSFDRKLSRLNTEEIRRLARTYLIPTSRTVVTTIPRTTPATPASLPARGLSSPASTPSISQDTKVVSPAKVERKNRAPVSDEILRVKLPRVTEAQLNNGLTVLVMEDHRAPLVWLQLNIGGAGSLYDPKNLSGLALITSQMLNEGTKTRTSQQIAEAIDRTGARITASIGAGSTATTVSAAGLSSNFDQWFLLLTDILLNPGFPADELNSLKQRLKVQLRQQRSSSQFLASERFSRAVFGEHPAALVSPASASIESITPEALATWHRERYCPQNAILGIAGDIRAGDIVPKLEKWLAAWQKTDAKEVLPANPVPDSSRRVYLVDRPNSAQSSLLLGAIAIDRRDPDYIPMLVMNRLIGGGPAARLWLKLREEKGYVFDVSSTFTAVRYPGAWRANADMRTDATEAALGEMLNEIRRICEEKVTREELNEARHAAAASFALSLEQMAQMLSYAIGRETYGFSSDYWDSYPAKVMAVSADDVQRVARKYLSTIQVVAVGDAAKLHPGLQRFGPVEVYDTDGNRAPDPSKASR